MKIKSITLSNFKTFGEEVSFTLNDLTALVGENSVGKSNVLEALDLFFNFSKTKISNKSYHHNNYIEPIKIELEFYKLSAEEILTFKSHLDEEQNLRITQIIKAVSTNEDKELKDVDIDEIDFEESKHGTKIKSVHEWASFEDKAPTKKSIKEWWKEDLKFDNLDFKSLFETQEEPSPELYQQKLSELWANHYDLILKERITGDEKVLGWKSKLKANLPKYFYIPAIKNIAEDLKNTKTSALGELIGWVSNSISNEIKEDFKEKAKVLADELMAKIDDDGEGNSKIGLINKALNENVGFDIGCSLELKFGAPDIKEMVFPEPKIFANDGYESELTEKGHGIQRLALFSLLRTYNTFDFGGKKMNRNIIIGIEEPEIYLHPPLKRATYNLLKDLSKGNDQIIYTTHDSYFISVEYFDEIRLFRKSEGGNPITTVHELSVAQLLAFFSINPKRPILEKSLRHRLYNIIDDSKNEGFFAKKIILIEGETEKYSLPNYFKALGFDIDVNRVALINAGSVDNISFLLLIFNEFRIPCYVIFDADRPRADTATLTGDSKQDAINKSKRNKEIFELLGKEGIETEYFFPDTEVTSSYAVWKYDFEEEFHKSLGNYDALKADAKKLYNSDSKPLTARYISEELSKKPEGLNPLIGQIIKNVDALSWTQSIIQEVEKKNRREGGEAVSQAVEAPQIEVTKGD